MTENIIPSVSLKRIALPGSMTRLENDIFENDREWTDIDGYTAVVYDGEELDDRRQAARDSQQTLAGLLQGLLYTDTRLEVCVHNLSSEGVQMYFRALDSVDDVGPMLNAKLQHVFVRHESQHPLERLCDDAGEIGAARRIEATYDHDYQKHLSMAEAHQTQDRPMGQISRADDIVEQMITQLGTTGHRCLVQFVLQPLPKTNLMQSRENQTISEDGLTDGFVDETFSKRESAHLDRSGKLWRVSCRILVSNGAATTKGHPEDDPHDDPEDVARSVASEITSKGGRYYRLTSTDRPTDTALARAKRCYLPLGWSTARATKRRLLRITPTAPSLLLSGRELAGMIDFAGGIANSEVVKHRDTRSIVEQYRRRPTKHEFKAYTEGPPIGRVPFKLRPDKPPMTIRLPDWLRRRHTAIIGSSGAGKSVTSYHMMLQLFRNRSHSVIHVDLKGENALGLARAVFATCGNLDGFEVIDLAEDMLQLPLVNIDPLLVTDEEACREARDEQSGDERIQLTEESSKGNAIDTTVRHALSALRVAEEESDDESAPDRSYALLEVLLRRRLRNGITTVDFKNIQDDIDRYKAGKPIGAAPDGNFRILLDKFEQAADERKRNIADGAEGRLMALFSMKMLSGMIGPPSRGETFDIRELVSSEKLVVFDLGDLSDHATQIIGATLMAIIWEVGNQPDVGSEDGMTTDLVIDEAHELASEHLLQDILTFGRSSDVALTLLTQSLTKVSSDFASTLNEEVGTALTAEAGESTARLFDPLPESGSAKTVVSKTPRQNWLTRLKQPREDESKPTIALESLPLPPGHPKSDSAFDAETRDAFRTAYVTMREEVRSKPSIRPRDSDDIAASYDDDIAAPQNSAAIARGTTLPRFERLPDCVSYFGPSNSIECTTCGKRYDPTLPGLAAAIQCHADFSGVDRSEIPIIQCPIHASAQELATAQLSAGEAIFLQLVHIAGFGDPHPMAFDSALDSFTELREMAGIDASHVSTLEQRGLLRKETTTPHLIYGLTEKGRATLNIKLTRGQDVGPYAGDLNESATHRVLGRLGEYLLQKLCVQNDNSAAVDTHRYYPTPAAGSGHTSGPNARFDCVAVDADADVVAGVECELDNNDHATSAVADYRQMASLDLERAIWIVDSRQTGISVNNALHEAGLVPQTYSSTAPRQMTHDVPGCTEMYTASHVKNTILFDT